MKISVDKPELTKFIREEVESGRFSTEAEVIEAGLARIMLDPAQNDLDKETLAAIDEAEEQYRRGEGRAWSEVRKEIRSRYPQNP